MGNYVDLWEIAKICGEWLKGATAQGAGSPAILDLSVITIYRGHSFPPFAPVWRRVRTIRLLPLLALRETCRNNGRGLHRTQQRTHFPPSPASDLEYHQPVFSLSPHFFCVLKNLSGLGDRVLSLFSSVFLVCVSVSDS